MLFSVLIANYNNSTYLEDAINSVLAQVYKNWEIVLVDDASTDNFQDVVKQFGNDKRIKVYSNNINYGCGYTKKKCAALASGDILGFLDPDDTLHPDALDIMIKEHTANPACSIVSSTHYICDETLRISRIAEYTKPLPAGIPYLLVGDGSIHAFASFKKSLYNKTEGISEKNRKAVDQDLYYKLEEEGDTIYINKPLYYYRIHSGCISNAGQGKAAKKIHHAIIKEACLRRIRNVCDKNGSAFPMKRKYETRYYKIRVVESFDNRNWLFFTYNLCRYFFSGGRSHVFYYLKKIRNEGLLTIRKSFLTNDEIKF